MRLGNWKNIFWLNNLKQFRVRGVSEIRPYFVGVIRVKKKMSQNVGMRVTALKRFYITLVIFGFWVVVYSLDLQVVTLSDWLFFTKMWW